MMPRGRKPSPLHGRGEIRGDAVYPISVLMKRLGIARNTLSSLRRRGLPVHSIGRRCAIVYGWELLAFLRSESDQGSNGAMDQDANNGDTATTVPTTVPGGPEE
ncbi:MAG: hypothetical protein WCJ35_06520 [Planctomycetota bacterium]